MVGGPSRPFSLTLLTAVLLRKQFTNVLQVAYTRNYEKICPDFSHCPSHPLSTTARLSYLSILEIPSSSAIICMHAASLFSHCFFSSFLVCKTLDARPWFIFGSALNRPVIHCDTLYRLLIMMGPGIQARTTGLSVDTARGCAVT